MDSPQNIISFCTGYGGIELGLRRVSDCFRTICYVEIETFAQANLVAKIEQGKMDAAPIWSNLKTFPAHWFSNRVHGIIGGYPCQPFSTAGNRAGENDPRHLWPYIRTAIRIIRPEWCFFENVSGHVTLGLKEVLLDLEELGYRVENDRGEPTWGLFTASEVGFPHKRERLFILAYSERIRRRGRNNGKPGGQGRTLQTEGSSDLGNPISKHGRLHTSGRDDKTQTGSASEAVADTEHIDGRPGECGIQKEPTGNRQDRSTIKGPARPGQPQHKWEEPRTVKSGMGRTINGFKSRVDELRLLGNGVVPQTAELAFRTLWNRI